MRRRRRRYLDLVADVATNELIEDEGDVFSYTLEFAAAKCPGCGEAAEPGPCPNCGGIVGSTEELSPSTEARIAALGPLADRIDQLILGFDRIEIGSIPITADQMSTAITDADLFGQIREMTRLGHDLGSLNLNDPTVIGRELRQRVAVEVGKVERLLETCRLLGRFDPPGPAADLRGTAIEAGAYGASLIQGTVETLVAPDLRTARQAQARLQELLGDVPFGDAVSSALEALPDWSQPDPDARISLVLGHEGVYSDDFGIVDIRRVFAAFADEPQPFNALASRARGYFSHLFDPNAPGDPALESTLILPALALATLDRPLLGHQVAVQVHELLGRAWGQDPATVQGLLERTADQGQLIFAAAGRIERGFQLLGLASLHGQADDQAVLQTVMDAYLELAEGAYRTYGWLVRDLAVILAGGTPAAEGDPPMLSNLAEQLEAANEDACTLLAAASDAQLRNAKGHAQYRWDAESEVVEDLRTGRRWTPGELEQAMMAMISTVLGVDAGYVAFLASARPNLSLPEWLEQGRSAEANTLFAHMSFGGFGFEVLEVADGGATVVIERPESVDKARLMVPAAGLVGVIRGLEHLSVMDPEGERLLEVDPTSVVEALAAPESVKDIACIGPLLYDAVSSGIQPAGALNRILWVQVAAVVITGTHDLIEAGGPDAEAVALINERLSFVLEFARGRDGATNKANARLLERVKRARAAAFATTRGEAGSFDRLTQQMKQLLDSVGDRDVSWPPF
jgi:hypothetical protein